MQNAWLEMVHSELSSKQQRMRPGTKWQSKKFTKTSATKTENSKL